MPAEHRTVSRIRRSPTPTEAIVLAYADEMAARLERFQNLDLTDDQIMQVIGPATDSIGGKDMWMFGQRDLLRLSRALLTAAVRGRSGG